ncbi:mannose-6-phosphate isomerase [Aristophania vespae]|uniref:Mannose-6-phosphate isomerase n=1 Tax=Aristophania vespae TaxID=2697033 RepID=A0A6P1NEK8_9PROT|nr:AGE family epimerase/isomerase [Aristophania vespae]QHI95843.1 mannose-6-phosphate isomerase [Aristophania vespae]
MVQKNWHSWLMEEALPLWSNIGFDHKRRLFHERLTFDHKPIELPALRLMVQARQISTYCRAELDGLAKTASLALDSLQEVEKRYWGSDGEIGWVFSLAPDGQPADKSRDLYAHAFILFAYAWAYQISKDPAHLNVARRTVIEIDKIFKAQNGGYLDAVPAPDTIRRQNPHMHLLEAYLMLFEVSGDSFYLEYAQNMTHLAMQRFILPHTGMLLEFFDAEWKPLEAIGLNRVEPGHLCEWSWLFSEFMRLAPETSFSHEMKETREKLFDAAMKYGVSPDTLIVCDAITDDGRQLENTTRIWPQTEFMRMLALKERENFSEAKSLIDRQKKCFFERYAPSHLKGGWIDRLDANGVALTDHMPASSLYHIYGPP